MKARVTYITGVMLVAEDGTKYEGVTMQITFPLNTTAVHRFPTLFMDVCRAVDVDPLDAIEALRGESKP